MDKAVDVLIPTCNRPTAWAITLTALARQSPSLRIIISDQSDDERNLAKPELKGVIRYLCHLGHNLETHRHWPRRGMAEQRAFLLAQVRARHCLFLDDDVIVDDGLIEQMRALLICEECGFVGSAVHGLSYINDHRPDEESIIFWDEKVSPETVTPRSTAWQRHRLHNAANLLHVQQLICSPASSPCPYRIAWVGGCVMYDTARLRDCGGFDFWEALPAAHCGEDVLAQLRVMAKYGGCGILPSGAYHLELPTTVTDRRINAPFVLELVNSSPPCPQNRKLRARSDG